MADEKATTKTGNKETQKKQSRSKGQAASKKRASKPQAKTRRVKLTDIQMEELLLASNRSSAIKAQIDKLTREKKDADNVFTGLLRILGESKNFDFKKVTGVDTKTKQLILNED